MIAFNLKNFFTNVDRSHMLWDDREQMITEQGFTYFGELYQPRSAGMRFDEFPTKVIQNMYSNHPVTAMSKQATLIPAYGRVPTAVEYIPWSVPMFRVIAMRRVYDGKFDYLASTISSPAVDENLQHGYLNLDVQKTTTIRNATTKKIEVSTTKGDVVVKQPLLRGYGAEAIAASLANGTNFEQFHKPFMVEMGRYYPKYDTVKKEWSTVKLTEATNVDMLPYRVFPTSTAMYGTSISGVPNEHVFSDQFHESLGHGLSTRYMENYTYQAHTIVLPYIIGQYSTNGNDCIIPAHDVAPGGVIYDYIMTQCGGNYVFGLGEFKDNNTTLPDVMTDVFVGPKGEFQMGGSYAPITCYDSNGNGLLTGTANSVSSAFMYVNRSKKPTLDKETAFWGDMAGHIRQGTIDTITNGKGVGVGNITFTATSGGTIDTNASQCTGFIVGRVGWLVGNISAVTPYQFNISAYNNSLQYQRTAGSEYAAYKMGRLLFNAYNTLKPNYLKTLGIESEQAMVHALVDLRLIGTVGIKINHANAKFTTI